MGKLGRRTSVLLALVLVLAACGGRPPAEQDDEIAGARAAEAANALPRSALYDTPPGAAVPGSVLGSERATGWQLPEGAAGNLVVYNSRSAQGTPVAASAAVLTPAGPPPPGGWPVVAWAHGTSGVARQCAPSLMKDLYYPDEIAHWLEQGYAVVAADYSGLGAGSRHEYITVTANANDVRYSVAAARQAVAGLSERWVAVGHSQGGQAVWGVARQEAAEPTGTFLGSVAIAPVTPYDRLQREVADNEGQGQYLAYVASSIAAQYPGFQPWNVISDKGMSNYERYLHEGCWTYGRALSGTGTPRELLRPDWSQDAVVREFIERNRYANAPLAGPIFVASGAADTDVAASTVAEVAAEQCGQGTPVDYHDYPGDHETVMRQSAADRSRWVADRFAGAPAPNTCSVR
ncbi:lipase [Saccharopolyspora erythraea]|uniref:lipase family protein n=1 Tax=Saccharopolyspora erythraea TaxID=1836 RepID=UPI001BA4A436|nr:lipase family protein [Saccharopolyspora erythraea]QUH03854.1 lipase [Saccharopolyspora erythraea]